MSIARAVVRGRCSLVSFLMTSKTDRFHLTCFKLEHHLFSTILFWYNVKTGASVLLNFFLNFIRN